MLLQLHAAAQYVLLFLVMAVNSNWSQILRSYTPLGHTVDFPFLLLQVTQK